MGAVFLALQFFLGGILYYSENPRTPDKKSCYCIHKDAYPKIVIGYSYK